MRISCSGQDGRRYRRWFAGPNLKPLSTELSRRSGIARVGLDWTLKEQNAEPALSYALPTSSPKLRQLQPKSTEKTDSRLLRRFRPVILRGTLGREHDGRSSCLTMRSSLREAGTFLRPASDRVWRVRKGNLSALGSPPRDPPQIVQGSLKRREFLIKRATFHSPPSCKNDSRPPEVGSYKDPFRVRPWRHIPPQKIGSSGAR